MPVYRFKTGEFHTTPDEPPMVAFEAPLKEEQHDDEGRTSGEVRNLPEVRTFLQADTPMPKVWMLHASQGAPDMG
jgi:hypothetical protein